MMTFQDKNLLLCCFYQILKLIEDIGNLVKIKSISCLGVVFDYYEEVDVVKIK
jgi:hypothetical protein